MRTELACSQPLAPAPGTISTTAEGFGWGAQAGRSGIRRRIRPRFLRMNLATATRVGRYRRRSEKTDHGENRSLGGSDPILSGTEAAQRRWRQGSLPPKVSEQLFSLRRQQI